MLKILTLVAAVATLLAVPPPGVVVAAPDAPEALAVADAPNALVRANIRWGLSRRVTRDQKARAAYLELASRQDREAAADELAAAAARVRAIDEDNAEALRGLVARYGWFPTDEWDWPTANFAWLIAQHADHDPAFQAQVLATMTPLAARGAVPVHHYANLYDRVAKNAGRPQRFGTQGRCVASGEWAPLPLEEPARIAELREAAGLGDLVAYAASTAQRCGAADPA